ncbi:MAG: TetR/AcrR family transcriptional regulator [Chloroflexi bacterium]|nr:TetR/AcrR family transcriptional regulator [Chloroflexota bacterium]
MPRVTSPALATGTPPGTAAQVLDVAERLVQTRGFNGFSYADIAAELGITKATLHYHFRTKAELGGRLIARYTGTFRAVLESIGASSEPASEKLARYARVYAEVLRNERMCLCGMLAAEYSTLPPPMQQEIRRFFDLNEAWLSIVLEEGRRAGSLRFDGPAAEVAALFLGALEGAMLVARSYADPARFDSSSARLLNDLTAPAK